MSSIMTPRLELVCGSGEIFALPVDDRHAWSRALGDAHVPASWPPELYDEGAARFMQQRLAAHPTAAGWLARFLVVRAAHSPNGERTLIGCAGFKGPPEADGACEIGYSVLPEFRRRGYANEAVRALVDWAFGHANVTRVVAETYPHLTPSIAVMERNGLSFVGGGSEHGVIRYERRRSRPA